MLTRDFIFLRQDGPAAGGTPPATPGAAPAAGSAAPASPPATPGSATPGATEPTGAQATPSSTAGAATPASGVTPPPPGGTPPAATDPAAAQRVADAQRRMHEATTKASELSRQINAIFSNPEIGAVAREVVSHPAPGAGTSPAAAPRPAAQPAPSPPPAAQQPPIAQGEQFFEPTFVENLWARYSNQQLPEKDAFVLLVNEVGRATASAIKSDPSLVHGVMDQFRQTQARQRANESVVTAVEAFWQEHGPGIPVELFWSFASNAQQLHPGNYGAQALYCLERAAEVMAKAQGASGASAAVNTALRTTPEIGLPGSGGPPAASATEGEAPKMIDQLRAMRSARHQGPV